MVENSTIKQMLEKAGANPFYFGGGDESYFWRVAEIDDEIFAERTQVVGDCDDCGCYCCYVDDKESRQNMYYDMVIDFAAYYCDYWRNNVPSNVFDEIAGPGDKELLEILGIFHKKYSDFLNDVMYWFSFLVEYGPNNNGVYEVESSIVPGGDLHLVKSVLKHLTPEAIVIDSEDTEYVWQIVDARGEIWYRRMTRYYRDNYIYITEEYGHVPREDVNAFEALRDAVLSCFVIEGWEIVEGSDDAVEEMLKAVNLTYEELLA